MFDLPHKLEALLFYKGEPDSKKHLAKLLGCTHEELEEAVSVLKHELSARGIRLLVADDELELVTAPETSELIASLRKDELERDLGKAGSETLAIVLYRGPATRAEIEYIRGVNSAFVLRNLMVRGLVERVPHPEKKRTLMYRPTAELLSHLGVTTVEDLPEYKETQIKLAAFEAAVDDEGQQSAAQAASPSQTAND